MRQLSMIHKFGWGQFFEEYLKNPAKVHNFAKNVRSSKSFFDEGLFENVVKNFSSGDYLFIEFGHNDEKEDLERHTDPFSTYKKYLSIYIDFAKKEMVIQFYFLRFIEENLLMVN